MKRIILIAITLVFIGYALLIASTQNIFGINNYRSFKNSVGYGRKLSGIGALFTRESTLINYQTLYQFYQHGKWQRWHLLEHETFNHYLNRAKLTELKHTHLDTHLGKDLYFGAFLRKKPLAQSQEYQTLVYHILLAHHNNQTPDSIRLVYQKKSGFGQNHKITNLLFSSEAL